MGKTRASLDSENLLSYITLKCEYHLLIGLYQKLCGCCMLFGTVRLSTAVVPKVGWGRWEYLGRGRALDGPLRKRCALFYYCSDLRPDIRNLVSLHQAHPSH
jgi:hypothetical protein